MIIMKRKKKMWKIKKTRMKHLKVGSRPVVIGGGHHQCLFSSSCFPPFSLSLSISTPPSLIPTFSGCVPFDLLPPVAAEDQPDKPSPVPAKDGVDVSVCRSIYTQI